MRQSRFVRDVATVATGVAAGQVIALIFTPFLTRLYGPEAFGVQAAFIAVAGIITPISTLGFAGAIVMPSTEEGAAAVARLSLICAMVVAPLTLVFIYFFQTNLAKWTGLEESPDFLYLIPASLLLGALLSVANQMAIRVGVFRAKAGSYVFSTLLANIVRLIGGFLMPSGLLLIVISMFQSVLNYALLLVRVPKRGAFAVRRWLGTKGIRQAAREQQDFALYRMPQSMINAAALGLPVILLTNFFGAAAAGQYAMTVLVLGAPVMLLGDSVAEVFYPKVTRALEEDAAEAGKLLWRATYILSLLAIAPFGFIILTGSWVFPLFFGDEWVRAGQYSQWISIWLAGTLASRASVAAFPALRLQGYLLIQEVASVILRVSALYVGFTYFKSDLVAVALFSLVGFLLSVGLCVVAFIRAGSQQVIAEKGAI